MSNLFLHSLCFHVPERVITNDDISKTVDTSDEWIRARTGIASRHMLAHGENVSDIGAKAALKALLEAESTASELTHIIVATGSQDFLSPSTACIIASKIGAGQAMAFDFSSACSGFIYGLSIAKAFLCADRKACILFVCTEGLSRKISWKDRSTCVLFGDGAAACVISAKGEGALARLESVLCKSDGNYHDLIRVGGGTACEYKEGDSVDEGFFISMNGRETYKHAVRHLELICRETLEQAGVPLNDISLFVPHQANMRIIEAVGERLSFPKEKVFTNLEHYGNTSSASIPIALAEARQQGRTGEDSFVLVAACGSGFTWGGALLRFLRP